VCILWCEPQTQTKPIT